MSNMDSIREVGTRIWRVINQIHPSNTYICATGEADGCFLVDPGTDFEVADSVLGKLGLIPGQIFATHGHFDHAAGAAFFQDKYGADFYLHEGDLRTLRGSNFLMMAFKIPFSMKMPRVDGAKGYAATLGGRELRVLEAPGHTPGSCFLQYGDALFTGDTLYSHGVGLSKLPGGNSMQLKSTLLTCWDRLPEQTIVYPGHGDCAPFATIRKENLPLLQFLGLAEDQVGE